MTNFKGPNILEYGGNITHFKLKVDQMIHKQYLRYSHFHNVYPVPLCSHGLNIIAKFRFLYFNRVYHVISVVSLSTNTHNEITFVFVFRVKPGKTKHYLSLHFRFSLPRLLWFCKCTTPWMFPPLDILLEYWIEHVSFGLLYVMFTFPTRIFYRGVPGFASDCPCGVWCRGLTTYFLYVGPLFGNLV